MTTSAPAHVRSAPAAPAPVRASAAGSPATRSLISDQELARPRYRAAYFTVLTVTTVLFAAAFLFPLYWMASSALETPREFAAQTPTLLPKSVHVTAYRDAW